MPSFSEILQSLKQDPSYSWAADTFLEIRGIAGPPEFIGLAKIDSLLSSLHPVVSAAAQLDQLYSPHWQNLVRKIPEIRELLHELYQDAALWENPTQKQPRIKVTEHSRYIALTSSAPMIAGNRLIPLNALLLIGGHANHKFWEKSTSDRFTSLFSPHSLVDLAERLRKYTDPTWQHFHFLTEYIPEWRPDDIEGWAQDFRSKIKTAPRTWGNIHYSGRTEHLFVLSCILQYVTDPRHFPTGGGNSALSQDAPDDEDDSSRNLVIRPPQSEPQFNAITGSELRAKDSYDIYSWQRPTTEAEYEATAPEIRSASPQEEIGSHEREKIQAISALEIRYTNYRTAMDNQRLPWAGRVRIFV